MREICLRMCFLPFLKKRNFANRAGRRLAPQGMRSFWPTRIMLGSFTESRLASKIFG